MELIQDEDLAMPKTLDFAPLAPEFMIHLLQRFLSFDIKIRPQPTLRVKFFISKCHPLKSHSIIGCCIRCEYISLGVAFEKYY